MPPHFKRHSLGYDPLMIPTPTKPTRTGLLFRLLTGVLLLVGMAAYMGLLYWLSSP